MLLTEEEAMTKNCHVARSTRVVGDDATIWRFKCVGSACMAWRWGPIRYEEMRSYHDDENALKSSYVTGGRTYPDGWQYYSTATDRDGRKFDLLKRPPKSDGPTNGFCGLAGVVE